MRATDRALQEQLLGRDVRDVLNESDRRKFSGQRLLVTGAGGTIGGELARQLAACEPSLLTLVDHSEYALFRIEQELRADFRNLDIDARIGDVSRRGDMRGICQSARPHAVYHAAAYKHVTITERCIVPATRVNVLGTYEVALAARQAGARFVLISSDKAAEPQSVMGATKRVAEIVSLSRSGRWFRPVAVRFGNIIGSSGSLVEIMGRCIAEGRNIPITHPDATRFFMTAGEAVSLVLKADLTGRRADVFWLDMGEPLRIGSLAERMIALGTARGATPVGIDIIGLRPGEKMHEHLTTQGLEMCATTHDRIWTARQVDVPHENVIAAVRALRRAVAACDAPSILDTLEAIAGYEASPAAWASARQHTGSPLTAKRSA